MCRGPADGRNGEKGRTKHKESEIENRCTVESYSAEGNLRDAAASLGYTADQGTRRIGMVGGDDVWHTGVSKTHWQRARSVAHAHNGGVAVYGSPESREYCGPRPLAVYEGVDRRARGRRHAT
jgi:hypothetical protein